MKTYYCVTTSFYDNGKVTAAITSTVEAAEKPQDSQKDLRDKDVYHEYFDSRVAAENWVKQAKKA